MTNATLEQVVADVICDIGKLLGHVTNELTSQTCPHKELSWFDSHLALLTSVEIGKRIGPPCREKTFSLRRTADGCLGFLKWLR
jgi:hypothetical protein